jgi:hypothetical protein
MVESNTSRIMRGPESSKAPILHPGVQRIDVFVPLQFFVVAFVLLSLYSTESSSAYI